jgi:hypothetical protein
MPPTNAGSYEVVGTINDAKYQGSATGTLEIGKAAQVVSFAAISDKLTTDSVNLTATGGSSGNAVTFAVTSGPGVITINVLSFTPSGSVTITASQVGNDNYLAAPDVISAQVWIAPEEIATTPEDMPDTSVGVRALLPVAPNPSRPLAPVPHHLAAPDVVSAQVCSLPAEIAATPEDMPDTPTGVLE